MRTSGRLDVQTSGCPNVSMSGRLDVWMSGRLDVRTSGHRTPNVGRKASYRKAVTRADKRPSVRPSVRVLSVYIDRVLTVYCPSIPTKCLFIRQCIPWVTSTKLLSRELLEGQNPTADDDDDGEQ